jgi:uncharacterized iron-regulated membrane protein
MSKPAFLKLHRRIALAAALFLLVQAVTGAMLAWRAELARTIDPATMLRHSPSGDLPLSRAIAQAAGQLPPEVTVKRLYFPDRADGVYFLELESAGGSQRYAAVDPSDGRVLKQGGLFAFPLQAALKLHYQLGVGPKGSFLIFLNGCALLLLALTGLSYWWPRPRGLLRSLAIRRSLPLRLQLRQWHRTGGVVAALVLIAISGTGLMMAGQEALDSLAPPAAPSAVPQSRPEDLARPNDLAPLDRALALAQARFAGAALRDVRFSASTIRVNFHAPLQGPRAVHQLTVDLTAMQVTKALPAQDNTALWMKLLPIHTGEFAGMAGRILFLLAALMLAALAISGPVLWWQRRPR